MKPWGPLRGADDSTDEGPGPPALGKISYTKKTALFFGNLGFLLVMDFLKWIFMGFFSCG